MLKTGDLEGHSLAFLKDFLKMLHYTKLSLDIRSYQDFEAFWSHHKESYHSHIALSGNQSPSGDSSMEATLLNVSIGFDHIQMLQ